MSPSHTDIQIRELCAKALVAQDEEFVATITELRVALRDRIEALSNLAVALSLQIPEALPEEDRSLTETKNIKKR